VCMTDYRYFILVFFTYPLYLCRVAYGNFKINEHDDDDDDD